MTLLITALFTALFVAGVLFKGFVPYKPMEGEDYVVLALICTLGWFQAMVGAVWI